MRTFRSVIALAVTVAGLTIGNNSLIRSSQAQPDIVNLNPIQTENQNTGSTGWQIDYDNPSTKVADDINGQIRGYASSTSVQRGNSINFHISVKPAQQYTIEVYRLGYYQGKGGRLMLTTPQLNGTQQPTCPQTAQTGLVQCNWAVGYTLNVPGTWLDGYYVAMLKNAQGWRSQIIFVVRDDARTADFVMQIPVLTYQAYNNYPVGTNIGKSLYDYNSQTGPSPSKIGLLANTGSYRAVKVSFDRPYSNLDMSNHGIFWEVYMIQWLEREGYNVTYITDIDAHTNPNRLKQSKGTITVGHDEYWTKEMRDGWDAARDAGVDLAFFGANDAYWQVRLDPNTVNGAANRVVTCYKDREEDPYTDLDPLGPGLTEWHRTTQFRMLTPPRPEQMLIGIQYSSYAVDTSALQYYQPYVAQNTSHWVYAGTSMTNGAQIPHMMGNEIDHLFITTTRASGEVIQMAPPISLSYTILQQGPFIGANLPSNTNYTTPNDFTQSTIYQAPSGAYVFATGTLAWPWGLLGSGQADPRVEQITRNVLNRFLINQPTPGTPTLTPTSGPSATPTNTPIAPTATPTNLPPTATPTPAPQVCVNNLFTNPGFESGLTDWADNRDAQTDTSSRTGSGAVRLTNAGGYVAQAKPPVVGSTYTLSAWGNRAGTSATGRVALVFFNAAFAELGRQDAYFQTVGTYGQASVSAVAPANTAYVYPLVYAESASASVPLRVDDMCLTSSTSGGPTPTSTPAPPTATPTNTPVGPTATPTNTPVGPTATPTNTPVGPTPTPTNTPVAGVCSSNLILNPGFESGMTNWGDNVGAQANGTPRSGSGALRLSATYHYAGQANLAIVGKTYSASAWTNRASATTAGRLFIIFFDNAGNIVQRQEAALNGVGSYAQTTVSAVAPANASYVYYQLLADNASTTAPIYADDLCLQ
ncbi:MAG: hypothetical protein KIH69_023385 [Anaerolineae bacterium]|nr:hypothetical protein [Anaerolineae bacterium]